MYRRHSRNSNNKNIEFEKAQEEIKETIESLYKHQSETKNMNNKEINELRIKTDNIKEERTQDMENLRKKNNGRPIQQNRTEDRISELEDEIVIKGKTEKLLNNSRTVKRICKNSLTPSKDQT
jgi:acetyl-CoA carboxylase alpha subunit